MLEITEDNNLGMLGTTETLSETSILLSLLSYVGRELDEDPSHLLQR